MASAGASTEVFVHTLTLTPLRSAMEASIPDILVPDSDRRPPITLSCSGADGADDFVSLGRNHRTHIADREVSRQLCVLRLRPDGRAFLRIRKDKHLHQISVDRRHIKAAVDEDVEVRSGQVLALLGTRYAYQVSIDRNARKAAPPPPAAAVIEASAEERSEDGGGENQEQHAPLRESARQHMLDDCTCPICMDLLVDTMTVNPCGHNFCGPCADDMRLDDSGRSQCPTCRGTIQSVTTARFADKMVWNMMLCGEYFGEDDIKAYLIRSGRTPTAEEMKSIFWKASKQRSRNSGDSEPATKKIKLDSMERGSTSSSNDSLDCVEILTQPSNAVGRLPHVAQPASLPLANAVANGVGSVRMGTCRDDAICID